MRPCAAGPQVPEWPAVPLEIDALVDLDGDGKIGQVEGAGIGDNAIPLAAATLKSSA